MLEPPQRGGSNEYSQSMFSSLNKKTNVYSWKPQFCYIKMGFKGVKIIYVCFRDINDILPRYKNLDFAQGNKMVTNDLKAPYSSKIEMFIQESFNKFIYSINTIIKRGIWQPLKFQ